MRFAIRPDSGSRNLLVLGAVSEDSLARLGLRADTVYEIRNVLDTLTIREVGPCTNSSAWGSSAGEIVHRFHDVLVAKGEIE